MTVDAVIFDWGGTLSRYVSTDEIDVWNAVALRLHSRVRGGDAGAAESVASFRDALCAAEARFWGRVHTDQRSGRLVDIVLDALVALGLDSSADELLVEGAAGRHLEAWHPHIQHHDDAAPTLAGLRDRGVKVGLLSNTHWPGWFHDDLLSRDGLADLIDACVYSSDLTHLKPHPSAFVAAMEAVGVTVPGRVVFVGDRPLDDIAGAQAVGMRTVLRPNSLADPHDVIPDGVIDDLGQLLPLIDAWS